MKVEARVHPVSATNSFADTYLYLDGRSSAAARLDVEYKPLNAIGGRESAISIDFLLIASVIYAVDKLVSRASADDHWTRELDLRVPVSDPKRWKAASGPLLECLRFLTGDVWRLRFLPLASRLARLSARERGQAKPAPDVEAICLFSGGLDSLIGTIDWLETHQGQLLLLGHHDGDVPGPKRDQQRLLAPMRQAYPRRILGAFPRVGVNVGGVEHTYRSRSLLFLALGMHAADRIRPDTPVLIPENGNIALNVPLTPARRGSCSTRTAHPNFLGQLAYALDKVGLSHPIVNTLVLKTKGECVRDCRNAALLKDTYPLSASCAKQGHRSSWIRRNATQCGRCMPCIYRRAALHVMDLDNETYGLDICAGEVPVSYNQGVSASRLKGSSDLIAMLSFLNARPPRDEIARLLLSNGTIGLDELPVAAALVERAMDEVRVLLREKAIPEIRRRAGLKR